MRSLRCRCGSPLRSRYAWSCDWCVEDDYGAPAPIVLTPHMLRPDPGALQVVWGFQLCAFKCMRTAVVWLDHQPLCADCAERLLERWELAAVAPDLASTMPALIRGGEERAASWRPMYRDERVPFTSPELEALRAQWQAFRATQLELS